MNASLMKLLGMPLQIIEETKWTREEELAKRYTFSASHEQKCSNYLSSKTYKKKCSHEALCT